MLEQLKKDLVEQLKIVQDSNLLSHARRELDLLLPDVAEDDPEYDDLGSIMNQAMKENALQLILVFASQGHSGFSASYCTRVVEKLMRYEPLMPLSGDDHEWTEVGSGVFQNNRCSHVFKENGEAYDSQGKIFREPSGSCFQNHMSRVPVTFPYTPKVEYVDVPEPSE